MINVLFVCLGNICRSPLAEGIFQKKVEEKKLQHVIKCDSAGTNSYHTGELSDHRTRKNALSHGLELLHCARTFVPDDFMKFDYIIPMDDSNMRNVLKLKPPHANAEIILMRTFDTIDKGASVPDPYFGGEQGFEEVYQILGRCAEALLQHIIMEKDLNE